MPRKYVQKQNNPNFQKSFKYLQNTSWILSSLTLLREVHSPPTRLTSRARNQTSLIHILGTPWSRHGKITGNYLSGIRTLKLVQQHSLKPNFPSTVLGTWEHKVSGLICLLRPVPLGYSCGHSKGHCVFLFSEYLQNTFKVPPKYLQKYIEITFSIHSKTFRVPSKKLE